MKVPTDTERLDFIIRRRAKMRTFSDQPAVQVGPNIYCGHTYREAIDIAIQNTEDSKAA